MTNYLQHYTDFDESNELLVKLYVKAIAKLMLLDEVNLHLLQIALRLRHFFNLVLSSLFLILIILRLSFYFLDLKNQSNGRSLHHFMTKRCFNCFLL